MSSSRFSTMDRDGKRVVTRPKRTPLWRSLSSLTVFLINSKRGVGSTPFFCAFRVMKSSSLSGLEKMASASSASATLSGVTTSLRRIVSQSARRAGMSPSAYMAALSEPMDVP